MRESTLRVARAARRQEDWTRESEAAALAALRRAAEGSGAKPVKLVYARQSKSDFDKDGKLKGPSIDQQFDSGERVSELQGLPAERYHDADRSGKETSRRPDYLRLIARIEQAAPGEIGAVCFYDQDRLHRNDIEFFHFMADMAERGILVFDANGLISNADKVSWKIKAVIAQEEREKIARKVRDNLAYLKRHGNLLGVIPQGYMRVDGEVVEDPEAAPIVRQIFALYGTGRYSLQGLADHLNRQGIRPTRGPKKENHTRAQAVIFSADVVKEIVSSRVYLGLVRVSRWRSGQDEWIEGKHPALVDQATWDACAKVRARNRRCSSTKRRRWSYPLTPILRCAGCGGTMHGESVSRRGQTYLYYACHRARRNRSSTCPVTVRCSTRWLPAERVDAAIRRELRGCLPEGALDEAYRAVLRAAVATAPDPEKDAQAAIRRLDEQLERAKRLYEYGEDTWETFEAKRGEIRAEQGRLRERAAARQGEGDVEWCQAQVLDLLAAWEAADDGERSRLLGSIFERVEAETVERGRLRLIGVPQGAWRTFFERSAATRESLVSRSRRRNRRPGNGFRTPLTLVDLSRSRLRVGVTAHPEALPWRGGSRERQIAGTTGTCDGRDMRESLSRPPSPLGHADIAIGASVVRLSPVLMVENEPTTWPLTRR